MREKGENLIAEKFERHRKIRNRINYYGKSIAAEEVNENKEDIKKVINILKVKYLKGITVA